MNHEAELRAAISATLATEVKAHSLVQACLRFGLEGGEESEVWASKARYVGKRLEGSSRTCSRSETASFTRTRVTSSTRSGSRKPLRFARAGGKRRISEITRTNLLDKFLLMGPLQGKLELGVFLGKRGPVDQMASNDPTYETLAIDLTAGITGQRSRRTSPRILGRRAPLEPPEAADRDSLLSEALELGAGPVGRGAGVVPSDLGAQRPGCRLTPC
jgi:hypothetical protein